MNWNKRSLELPVCPEEDTDTGLVNNGWVPKLYYFQRLFTKKQLYEEIAIIQRILYKNTLQHRKSAHLRKLVELSRCLKRFQELNLSDIMDKIIPTKTGDKDIYKLPSREMVSFFLTRLVGGYKLLSKTINVLEDTYVAFHAILRQGLFMPFALIVMSSTSRLHIYFQFVLKEMNLCYKMSYHWMSTLKQVKNKEYEIGLTESIDDIVIHSKSIESEYSNYLSIQKAIDESSEIKDEDKDKEMEKEEKPIIIEESNNELSSSFWGVLGSDSNDAGESSNNRKIQESSKLKEKKINKKKQKQHQKKQIKTSNDNIIDNIFDSLPISLGNKNKTEKEDKEENEVNGLDLIDKLFNTVKDNSTDTNSQTKQKQNKKNNISKGKKDDGHSNGFDLIDKLFSSVKDSNGETTSDNDNQKPQKIKNKKVKKRKLSDINNEEDKNASNNLINNDDIDMIFSGKITTKTVIKPLDKLSLNTSSDQDRGYNNRNKKMKRDRNNNKKFDRRNKKDDFEATTDTYLESVLKQQEELKVEEERQNNILDKRMKEMKKNKKQQKKKKNL